MMETKDINIGVQKVETKLFSMTSDALKFKSGNSALVKMDLVFNSPGEDKIFSLILNLSIVANDNDKTKLATLKVENSFFVDNIEEFVFPAKVPDGPPEIDGNLIVFCLEMSISHARGIWSAKTEGTPLSIIVIPIVSQKDLMGQFQLQADVIRKQPGE